MNKPTANPLGIARRLRKAAKRAPEKNIDGGKLLIEGAEAIEQLVAQTSGKQTKGESATRAAPAPPTATVVPGVGICGHAHPQAPHLTCTLPKDHPDMHTSGTGVLWNMAR